MIPDFREDGYLPVGLHLASEEEVASRFGEVNSYRRRLLPRFRRWLELSREIGVRRFLVGGSFITSKEQPNDIDAAVLVPEYYQRQIDDADPAALELHRMIETHRPAEVLVAYDEVEWEEWIEFFSQTFEDDGRRRGIVEVRV